MHMEKEKPRLPFPSDALQQLRHLSIPLWTRIGVVLLVLLVFVGNLGFFVYAFSHRQEKWLEASVTILGTTFLPTIVIVYIAFAETGTKALSNKTKELLTDVIPSCLRQVLVLEHSPGDTESPNHLRVAILGNGSEGPTCRYRVDVVKVAEHTEVVVEHLLFFVDINVSKVNISLLIPTERLDENPNNALSHVQEILAHTLEGAKREDYGFNPHLVPVRINGSSYHAFVLIKRMADDFLWDPAKQLYFAQDLRFFIASALTEGSKLFALTR